jgi:hypothetical protein
VNTFNNNLVLLVFRTKPFFYFVFLVVVSLPFSPLVKERLAFLVELLHFLSVLFQNYFFYMANLV